MNRKSALFLRIAAVITLLFAAGHTLGAAQSWSPLGETEVLRAMRSFRFDVDGVSRAYIDFYLGFGFIITLYLLLQAVLLWQIAALTRTDPLRWRPIITAFVLVNAASAVVSWKFIFHLPVIFSAVIAACLALALLPSRARKGLDSMG